MAILVTRPAPDNETTAADLRARGYQVLLAPALRCEPIPLPPGADAGYGAVIVTSANALRAVAAQLKNHPLLRLPVFAVGDKTAATARQVGFGEVISAEGDAQALRDLVVEAIGVLAGARDLPLLYLAGAELSRDLEGELGARGIDIVTRTTYRMVPEPDLPREVCEAFAVSGIEAVLHYSAGSARAFLEASRAAGVEIAALAAPQCCLSASVAQVLRDAGASRVRVAPAPNEQSLLAALARPG